MNSELDLLKQLRDITGAGIMDCKKYLKKSNNNLDEAIKLMRSEAGIKADKKSSRIAAEGVVFFHSVDNNSILIEINSETDFVARSDDFILYVRECCEIILKMECTDHESLAASNDKKSIEELEEHRKNAITKLGENIVIRRFKKFSSDDGHITGYTHNNKIGSVVILENENNSLGKDICMQIVASNPLSLDQESMDKSVLASEIHQPKIILRGIVILLFITNVNKVYKLRQILYIPEVYTKKR